MKVSCKGIKGDYSDCCKYDGVFFCKNPDCNSPVITSTCYGAHPSGCPIIDKWNNKVECEKVGKLKQMTENDERQLGNNFSDTSIIPSLVTQVTSELQKAGEQYIIRECMQLNIDPNVLTNQLKEIHRLNGVIEKLEEENGLLKRENKGLEDDNYQKCLKNEELSDENKKLLKLNEQFVDRIKRLEDRLL